MEGTGVVLEALMETILCIAEMEVARVDEVHDISPIFRVMLGSIVVRNFICLHYEITG